MALVDVNKSIVIFLANVYGIPPRLRMGFRMPLRHGFDSNRAHTQGSTIILVCEMETKSNSIMLMPTMH